MGILKPEKKHYNYKLVGASIPPRDNSYLTLYSIAKGVSKSSILKRLINPWLQERRAEENENNLINQIIFKINIKRKTMPDIGFKEFTNLVKEELIKKGVNCTHITLILSQIEDGKNEK